MTILTFTIEDKPVRRQFKGGARSKYNFGDMKVGQSFYIDSNDFNVVTRVRAAASAHGRKYEQLFSVVREGEGYRCGRIK